MTTATATKAKNQQQSAKPAPTKPKAKASRAVVVQHPSAPRNLTQVLVDAARDPKVDVAKMNALRQFVTEQAWMRAMLAVQKELPPIVKTAWNPHTKSKYAKLEDVLKEIGPYVLKHNMVLTFGMDDSPKDDNYRITCDVMHIDPNPDSVHITGHTRHYFADIGSDVVGAKGGGTKSGAQGSGSSIAYGRRYLLGLVFNLAIVGEDNDGAGAKKVAALTQPQLDALADLLDGDVALTDKFLAAFGITTVENLPPAKFKEALDRIKAAKANRPK